MQDKSTLQGTALMQDRPRLLMIAYCFSPHGSMEERNGWQRAILATRQMDVTVIYEPTVPLAELNQSIPAWVARDSLELIPIDDDWFIKQLKRWDSTFYLSYRFWHWRVFQRAKAIHQKRPFAGSHLVTLCGFREPGYVWKMNIPHLWGPLGGTHNFPKAFLRSMKPMSQLRERVRSVLNHFQLNRSSRIRLAMRRSAAVIAATKGAQSDFKSGFGIECEVELETGIDHPIQAVRNARNPDQPLRILWSGRLRQWKGLPILLHAIAALPKSVAIQVRIVGDGGSKFDWMKLASKLGVANCIEWIPWPTYEETLQYYSWADVFAFTSFRDTSGTGLVEALAAGCPIVGLDHQGAKDIMTSECAIRVSPVSWDSTVSVFSNAIARLATDHEEWLRLSRGASERAKDYFWQDRSGCVDAQYKRFIIDQNRLGNHL